MRTSRHADAAAQSYKIGLYNQHTVAIKFLGYETVTLSGEDLLELKTVRHANYQRDNSIFFRDKEQRITILLDLFV